MGEKMKRFFNILVVAGLLVSLQPSNTGAENLLVEPESVVYDSLYNRYLVSNYGNGAIVQIDSNGEQSYFNTELMPYYNTVGLHIKDGLLYAAANGVYMGVKVFDLATGVMQPSIDIPGSFLLNDVTTDTSGYLYVTDYEAYRLYKVRLSDYNVSLFVNSNLPVANGIIFDARNNRLLVSTYAPGNSHLVEVNLQDSTVTQVHDMGVQTDGVSEDDERNIYYSAWSTSRIYRVDPNFEFPRETVLSGFTDPADIYFNKKLSEVAVPNFGANRVDIVPLDVGAFTRLRKTAPIGNAATFGVSWADIDIDSYPDLYLANNLQPDGQGNGLFHNDGGAVFDEIISGSIVEDSEHSSTSTWGDCDNDGDLDVFVANGPGQVNRLYLNNGDGTFFSLTEGELVTEVYDSPAASWIDYDNDGNLDLFVANIGANSLFRNNGAGFEKITDIAIVTESDNSYGACWGDYNNDGYADLFMAVSDNQNNQLFTNNGDGTFTKIVGRNIVEDGGNSRGGSWGDYDNDGDLDLFVPNTSDEDNFLYNNNGDGSFTRITAGDIVNDGGCSYGSAWGDYDNDGDLDLYVANITGGVSSGKDFFYRNDGAGSFTKLFDCEIVDEIEDSYSAAWGDYDRDGDLDIFVARADGVDEADNGFYKNNGNENNWINIKCVGEASNGAAIGTKVRVKANIGGEPVWQMCEISAQTGFGSQNSLEVHFGLGDALIVDTVVIEWTTGVSQEIANVDVNQLLEITDYVCGDANGDKQINVGDAVFLIAYVFNSGPAPIPEIAGDANSDGQPNIGDAVYLINYVFKGGPAPCS
jgi:hypothetical protein